MCARDEEHAEVKTSESRPLSQGYDALEWGSDLGEPIAFLRVEPEQLATRAGVSFSSGHDDLDYVKVAMVTAPSGAMYALVRHERSPEEGTQVVSRSVQPSTVLGTDLEQLLQQLRVPAAAVAWIRPDVARALPDRRPLRRIAESLRMWLSSKSTR
jgi:hypothetical protein